MVAMKSIELRTFTFPEAFRAAFSFVAEVNASKSREIHYLEISAQRLRVREPGFSIQSSHWKWYIRVVHTVK
jgi:hypothetical protein